MPVTDVRCEKCGEVQSQLIYSPVRRKRLCTHCALTDIARGESQSDWWAALIGYLAGIMTGGLITFIALTVTL